MQQSAGPVMIDLTGLIVNNEERELLQHPHVGGVILFARNYESPAQITELCATIRKSRQTPLLIAVDQEGGRVQRFKNGFIHLPPMGELGELFQENPEAGLQMARSCGWIMAAELLAAGVDLSFAPVLDLNRKHNTVIGDRSFGKDIDLVGLLAKNVMEGMHQAGMASTGKHFPGHGFVKADSHLELPLDPRDFTEIFHEDMQPFVALIKAGIDALMPAHILFPEVDSQPVGFSAEWLQNVLRKKLQFTGMIFSDDLNMAGAGIAGDYVARAEAALSAGCDMTLICNNRAGAIQILDGLPKKYSLSAERFNRLRGKFSNDLTSLHASDVWNKNLDLLARYRKIYDNNT